MAPKPIGSSAQYQDITQVLKGITDFYPPESCLRELLQNADDAGATEIEYVLDTKTYTVDPGHLIDSGLQGFQGPALLARNNALFTEDDIRSLCSVGVSGKRDDILVAGKFGRGFNSVYHWTDNPSIYSENRLLFQDPQHSWTDGGGSVYETIHAADDTEDPHCLKAKAQLQAFSEFPLDVNLPYPGTIIRIPLRTGNQAPTSKICRKEATTQQIRKYLLRFAKELGDSGLLFVKHITKVTLRVDKEELSVTQVLNVNEVSLARQQVLRSLKSREDYSRSLEMEISHFLGANVSPQKRQYVIQHVLRRGSGDQSLDDWAHEGKLLPWVAVAVQVSPLGSPPCSLKPLSSTLCLPKKIKQPVFMHGLWAIAPDRQRLSTESSGESWNLYLFSTLVATAWKDLLLYRNTSSPMHERFQFWPNSVETIEDPWDNLHDKIVESAIKEDLPIWNTTFSCVNSKEAFFAEEKFENDNFAPALARIEMPVVYLPSPLYIRIRKAPGKLQTLQPATALAYLHANSDKLSLVSPGMKLQLLEYCCGAKAFAKLAELPLWPFLNGSFSGIKNSLALLPRSKDEMELFRRSKPDLTIDVGKLTSRTFEAMRLAHDKLFKETSMRHRTIFDLIEEWPTLYPVSSSNDFHIGRPTRLDNDLLRLWAWICQRGSDISDEDVETAFGKFPDSSFVFPLRGGRIRHFSSKSEDMPTLIVLVKDLEALLVRIIEENDTPPFILDESILQKSGLGLGQRISSKLPTTQIETSESLLGFARWLVAAKDLLLGLSDEDRALLIKNICRVNKKRYDPVHLSMIADCLRQLPIFQMEAPRTSAAEQYSSSFDHRWINLTKNLDYVSIANLPAVPTQAGVIFINLSAAGMEQLARTFQLVKTLSIEDLLRDYVIPAIEGKFVEKTSERRLIDFVLEASVGLFKDSKDWRKHLAKARIIPTQSRQCTGDLKAPRDLYDPASRNLQRLFFADEAVFPDLEILKDHYVVLKQCGLYTEINAEIIKSRIRYFEKTQLSLVDLKEKVSNLVQTPLTTHELNDHAFVTDIKSRRWIPAATGSAIEKLSPKDCRPREFEDFVDQTHGLVDFSVSATWLQLLEWDKPISFGTLLKQISKFIEDDKPLEVQKVLDYVEKHCTPDEYVPHLTQMECIAGSQGLYLPRHVFSLANRELSRLAPYMDILHPAVKLSAIHKNLGVRDELVLEDLLEIQDNILESGESLDAEDLDISVTILHFASSFPRDQLTNLMGPTQECTLVKIAELTISGDPGRQCGLNVETLHFVHHRVPLETLSKLQIATLRNRMVNDELKIDEEDDDEYTPQEELTTIISDCLRRYTSTSTFTEYVANAEDCGATEIAWMLDECTSGLHQSEALLTEELSFAQGPALFAYNNGLFSEKDFEGFKQIGRGSKADDETSIGMFGRGAITMYHFTDIPMILSGSYFLILDPQQKFLPMNTKTGRRKAGIKVPLERARRLFPDQLAPFEGIYGYVSTKDSFNGTIFRFPLRSSNTSTSLVESKAYLFADGVAQLLEDYAETAARAPVFLRNIRTISYSRRSVGRAQWTVLAQAPVQACGHIQKMAIRRMDLQPLSGGIATKEDLWWFATYDNSVPANMETPAKLKLKRIQCGVATCPDAHYRIKHSIFCTLPTSFPSSLPISFHGIFAITGDRQTIPQGDLARETESAWNDWLLRNCIPRLYLRFLADACALDRDNVYRLWPSGATDDTSKLVKEAFWNLLAEGETHTSSLFPLIQKPFGRGSHIASLKTAYFDFLQETSSQKLRPLLLRLFPKLVRLPGNLHTSFLQSVKNANVNIINDKFLCDTFQQEDACTELEAELGSGNRGISMRIEFWIHLMTSMMPPSGVKGFAEVVAFGCRVLPLRNGKLGKIMSRENSIALKTYLRGTSVETALFEFAAEEFVNYEYEVDAKMPNGSTSNPIQEIILSGLFNVRKMILSDIGNLLKSPASPLKPAQLSKPWLEKFWEYFNPKLRARLHASAPTATDSEVNFKQVLKECSLMELPIYLATSAGNDTVITPKQFESGTYMVHPSDKDDADLCSKIPGLTLIDQDYIPYPLREGESNLSSPRSFQRLMQCLLRIRANKFEGLEEFLTQNLGEVQLDRLRGALSDYMKHETDPSLLPVLQSLPVWPPMDRTNSRPSSDYIPSKKGIVNLHKELVHPWVNSSEGWMDPVCSMSELGTLYKLGKTPLSVQEVWDKVSPDIPQDAVLNASQFEQFRRLIEQLSKSNIKPEIPIAPDGNGKLRLPESLYDDTESIFSAAFRLEKEEKFLHQGMRSLREFWKSIGLCHRQTQGALQQSHYGKCVQALYERSRMATLATDQNFQQDVQHVLDYVCWERPEFSEWSCETWKEIAATPIFKVKLPAGEKSYRQARMRELAGKQTCIAPAKAGLAKHTDISWSQLTFLDREPIPKAYDHLPLRNTPTLDSVVEHLEFMMGIRPTVPDSELPAFLHDVQKSYGYLQEFSNVLNPEHKAAKAEIWLNLETTVLDQVGKADLESSSTTVGGLCFHCPVDPLPVRFVRSFLVPYERLLKALGCHTVKKPPIPRANRAEAGKSSPNEAMMASIAALRKEGVLFDVTLAVENDTRQMQAHRVILAAGSSFFKAASSDFWKKPLVTIPNVSFKDLEFIIEHFYTGIFALPTALKTEDNDAIADKLDNCLDLLTGTDFLGIPWLHEAVENHILDKSDIFIRPDSVRALTKIAREANATTLRDYCKKYEDANKAVVDGCERLGREEEDGESEEVEVEADEPEDEDEEEVEGDESGADDVQETQDPVSPAESYSGLFVQSDD